MIPIKAIEIVITENIKAALVAKVSSKLNLFAAYIKTTSLIPNPLKEMIDRIPDTKNINK